MPHLRGSQHYSSKLTEEDVKAIKAGYIPGTTTYKGLAAEYGVTVQAIAQIITGKTWKHVSADDQ